MRRGKRRANGEGSIWTTGGRTRGRITIDGATYYRSGATRGEVAAKIAALRVAAEQGKLVRTRSGRQTVADYLRHWVAEIRGDEIVSSSRAMYATRLWHVQSRLGTYQLRELTSDHIRACYADMKAHGLSATYIRSIHGTLSGALKYAVEIEHVIPQSPMVGVKPPKEEHREMQTLTPAQIRSLLAVTNETRLHALWALLTHTGMRFGEAAGLHWDDIDWEKGTISIRRAAEPRTGEGIREVAPKTPSARRTVRIRRHLIAVLREHQQRQRLERVAARIWPREDLVFTNREGTFLRAASAHVALATALREAKLPRVRIHDLRHSFATIMLSRPGANVKQVSEMMGHANVTTTLKIYAHVTDQMHEEASGWMDDLLAQEA